MVRRAVVWIIHDAVTSADPASNVSDSRYVIESRFKETGAGRKS